MRFKTADKQGNVEEEFDTLREAKEALDGDYLEGYVYDSEREESYQYYVSGGIKYWYKLDLGGAKRSPERRITPAEAQELLPDDIAPYDPSDHGL